MEGSNALRNIRNLYLRFKADESPQALTGAFRQTHPEDNNEWQLIHEHESAPAAKRSSDAASGPRSEHLLKHYRRKDNESA